MVASKIFTTINKENDKLSDDDKMWNKYSSNNVLKV